MTSQRLSLSSVLPQLLHDTDCVSFYEALAVAHEARRHDSLDPSIIQLLLQIHDAAHTTDGARGILSDFVKGYQARLQNQRFLGARPITQKDHGKLVRVAVGATLVLLLDERRLAGYLWEVAAVSEDPLCQRLPDPAENLPKACFEITWARRGHMFLTLREELHDRARAGSSQPKVRQFELQVIVE